MSETHQRRGAPERRPRTWRAVSRLWCATYFSCDRWKRALLGVRILSSEEATAIQTLLADDDAAALLLQLKQLFADEATRADTVRARSDQLLTRIILAITSIAGAIAFAHKEGAGFVAVTLLAGAAVLLVVSMLMILKNLGKEEYYQPLGLDDLLGPGRRLRPFHRTGLILEYHRAVSENTLRNDDAVDRRALAHGLFVLAILIGAAGLVWGGFVWAEHRMAGFIQGGPNGSTDQWEPGREIAEMGTGRRDGGRPLPTVSGGEPATQQVLPDDGDAGGYDKVSETRESAVCAPVTLEQGGER